MKFVNLYMYIGFEKNIILIIILIINSWQSAIDL